jgi:MFS family permease
MSVFIGLLGWLVIATYWPVIAESKGISSNVRGLVEFSYAIAQAVGALLLIGLRDWHHKPWLLPVFALLAITALLIFGIATTAPLFIAGAAIMGLFTATTFIYSIYHCMLDSEKACKRVAMNEMMVGFGYVCAPALASLLHRPGTPFFSSFAMTAGIIALMVAIQTTIAVRLSNSPPSPLSQERPARSRHAGGDAPESEARGVS